MTCTSLVPRLYYCTFSVKMACTFALCLYFFNYKNNNNINKIYINSTIVQKYNIYIFSLFSC